MSACIFFLVCSLLGSVSSFFMILFVRFQKNHQKLQGQGENQYYESLVKIMPKKQNKTWRKQKVCI